MSQAKIITAKYAGKCACCGGAIKAGEMVEWERSRGVSHMGGLDGNSAKCTGEIRRRLYEPDPVDMAYEDQCAEICGR